MGRKRIRLTEEKFKKVFDIISEAKNLSDLLKIGAFSWMTPEIIKRLAELDPTYKGGDYAGKYTLWLIDQFNKDYNILNRTEIKDALAHFQQIKNKLQDQNIKSYSVDDIIRLYHERNKEVNGITDGPIYNFPSSLEMIRREPSQQYVKYYDNGEWQAYVPITWEASRKLAGQTEWCTASSNPETFDLHMMRYGGVCIYCKNGEPRYQYCYCNGEVKNAKDSDVGDSDDEYNTMPEDIDDSMKEALIYARRSYGAYLKKRMEYIKAQNPTVETFDGMVKEHSEFVDGLCSYRVGGLYGVARAENDGRVTLLTKPEFGFMRFNKCGLIALDSVIDYELYESDVYVEEWIFVQKDGMEFQDDIDRVFEYLINRSGEYGLKFSSVFDIVEDGSVFNTGEHRVALYLNELQSGCIYDCDEYTIEDVQTKLKREDFNEWAADRI